MNIALSDHFSYKKLFKFTLPSVIMMVFTSIYGVVDGFFVSNYVGKTPFAAVNLIYPFIMILGAIGFMFGTGGSALISKTLGEGNDERAKEIFSLIVYVSIGLGAIVSALGIVFTPQVAVLLGAEGEMVDYCVTYARIILLALVPFLLQYEFQSFFVTSGKPQLGLFVTVAAGVTNMLLDWLFVAALGLGIVGAAAATASSQVVGGIVPLIYFARKNSSLLKLTKTKWRGRALLITCTNGSSELMSNISMSLVSMLYNFQLMKYAGEDGVAAYGVLMYVNMIFLAIFIGYSVGTAPLIGYNFGSGNHDELKSLLKKSLLIIVGSSVFMLIMGLVLARPLSMLFVSYDKTLLDITLRAFSIFSFSFLFAGMAIYGSSFFTALNNGLISALISFLRTLVFQIAAVILLPLILGIDGIWISIVVAELMATLVTIVFMVVMRKKYQYW